MPLPARNALFALLITIAILGTIVFTIHQLDQERLRELDALQVQLATDTLSLETQFSLLEEAPCEDLSVGTELTQEVSSLGDRLGAAESRLGSTNVEVLRLKKQYTLLQIRDYLLTKRLAATCDIEPITALYFYSNEEGQCENCDRAGYALSYLRQTYPSLRVYSFDYNLDLGALKTLVAVEKINNDLPAFVINGKRSYGFTDLETFQKLFPEELFATSTATTSKPKR
ncbi:hypothetical protein KKD81_00785 [Patescibacteria group bacterium]|nr:hypothetical protein [Patescibacteria group bacterium]MBU2159238.1 hypothetical protein [Patescibacteria group bacterium]MBU2220455.1 hypothetical protein [Patescibacteria group bacterium]